MNRDHAVLYLLLASVCAGNPSFAHGQRAILLLRHAERVEYESPDGPISEAGTVRAKRLANLLRDAGVTAIYTSERRRTIQTAQPLAEALNIPLTSIGGTTAAEQVETTITRVRSHDQNGVVVIVGHGNTVPMLLKAFGHEQEVTIGPREHDDLFVVLPTPDGPPTLLRLNY